jgi:hypothetical protein
VKIADVVNEKNVKDEMMTQEKNCKWKRDQAIHPAGRSMNLRVRMFFFFMEIEKSLIVSILFIYYFLLLQLISCSSIAQSARMDSIGLHV